MKKSCPTPLWQTACQLSAHHSIDSQQHPQSAALHAGHVTGLSSSTLLRNSLAWRTNTQATARAHSFLVSSTTPPSLSRGSACTRGSIASLNWSARDSSCLFVSMSCRGSIRSVRCISHSAWMYSSGLLPAACREFAAVAVTCTAQTGQSLFPTLQLHRPEAGPAHPHRAPSGACCLPARAGAPNQPNALAQAALHKARPRLQPPDRLRTCTEQPADLHRLELSTSHPHIWQLAFTSRLPTGAGKTIPC